MKTKEELKALKEEYESLSAKLAELTEEELAIVSGGDAIPNITLMRCCICNQEDTWTGDLVGKLFDCPYCGKVNSFIGISLLQNA